MSVKKHIVMGMITGLAGMALISGGTVAFFSDDIYTENKVLSGTLDLDISDNDGVLFEFVNKKPGDTFDYSFDLINAGTLGMKDITLYSDYETANRDGVLEKNGFAEQLLVTKLQVDGHNVLPKEKMTLAALKENPVILAENIASSSSALQVYVAFEFIKTEKDQNKYQGNTMKLHWTFEAIQEDGDDEISK